MERLEILRKYLRESVPPVWGEPFHEAWMAGINLDERVRFAQAQAAEMSAAKPVIKPGELIIGNNALHSAVSALHTPFSSGIRFNRDYLSEIRNEHPEAESKLAEIDSYWTKWMLENSQYTPMTCHASLAYERLLTLGVDGMREYVERWRNTNTAIKQACDAWYDALLITLNGISDYINAHAIAAEEVVVNAQTAKRREELERIASACRHSAHGSPRSFHEAVQFFYLIFSLCGHDSPGPIDRILYPHLKRDLDNGELSTEYAQEILDCLYLKFEEKTAYGATIGGQKRDGSDVTNELSHMCVRSIKRLRLLSPRTALRWHKGIAPKLFAFACESVAEGATFPAFVNDEAIIPAMVERGVSLGDAREYTFVGCGQTYPHGRGHGNYEDVVINSAKPLELTLNDGIDPVTNQRLGPTTGKPNMLLSYEQFEKAYRQQMDNHISERIRAVNDRRSRIKGHAYDFLRSLLTYSCVECGLDWHEGGADYSEGMVDMVGLTTVTDSLVAVKRGVYEEKVVSLEELVNILNQDWNGHESLRRYFLSKIPKFGNDCDEADDVAAIEVSRINDFIKSYKTCFGGPWGMDIIGWSGAVQFGLQTGATPDGRHCRAPLADCAGPAQGRNVSGLTPTLYSVLKLPHHHVHGPMALSLRFPKQVVRSTENRKKLQAMIETYFHQGGQQLQISIASTEDMKQAQKTPEAYRSLMVRVGGFSAYFTQLDKKFQDDMIVRSELEF